MMPAATIAGRRSRALPGLLAALLPLLPAGGKAQEATPGELPPLAGYVTRLRLDTPIHAGSARTITGSGAPTGNGIWVELWRVLGPGRVELTIHEGRMHQVKRMLAAVGHPVTRLHRSRYGPLTLDGLAPGESRELDADEVTALRRSAGL